LKQGSLIGVAMQIELKSRNQLKSLSGIETTASTMLSGTIAGRNQLKSLSGIETEVEDSLNVQSALSKPTKIPIRD
jgi:hypothetical protein